MLTKHSVKLIRANGRKLAITSGVFQTKQFHMIRQNNIMKQFMPMMQMRRFSDKQEEIIIDSVESEPVISQTEKKEFKAETRKLLDIVAHSIYTDKEVFLRELMSNCSDALEKQRYAEISGYSRPVASEGLFINVTANEKERTITIFDSGIGMSRDEITENLGTIAKSGSQEFLKKISNNQSGDNQTLDSIIGQFGVGFYSTFIVADMVEVFTKNETDQHGVRWVSDGSGEFEVSTVDNIGFTRGTKIVLKLKPECREFSRESTIDSVLKKYSLFITYPIKLNGQLVNNLQAIWYRDKKEVSEDEYERFFEHLANTKIPYKFKLHYSTDVPISIKAIFYVPSAHGEKMGLSQESNAMHLYCRKVLIKERCQELVPSYLRFMKGVVDCEDLPLNISRETYQDSGLIHKLRNVVTRRILKLLEDEMKRDPRIYDSWFETFNQFLKEGLMTDTENQEQLLKLMRYSASFDKNPVTLEDYLKKMKPDQKKIYFVTAPSKEAAEHNPFMESFKGTNVPVLYLTNNVDEICFSQITEFKGNRFVNIETSFDEISKDIGDLKPRDDSIPSLPEDDVTTFSLWLKNELASNVGKVTISKRLKGVPAVLYGQVSSSMRMVMQMMEQNNPGQMDQMNKANTLEINPHHPIIVKMNQLRKKDQKLAALLSRQMMDNVLMTSGIPINLQESTKRNLDILNQYLHDLTTSQQTQEITSGKDEASN